MSRVRTPAGGIMTREQHARAVYFARKANSVAWLLMLLPAVDIDGEESP